AVVRAPGRGSSGEEDERRRVARTISRVIVSVAMRRLTLSAAAVVIAGIVVTAPVSAQTTATLSGESFSGTPTVSGSCNSIPATVTFTASGIAAGPYPGTFTATGAITYG